MSFALALPAHAKLNLDLRVVGRRADGWHDLATRFQAISLHDLLLLEQAHQTTLAGGFGAADLVLRAQALLERAVGRSLPARFRLAKRIPVRAGLGGGSADAAAALRGLIGLHRLDLGAAEVREVAAKVGADVPFLLQGGAALATGRGEELRPVAPVTGCFALASPGWGIDTAAVYAAWDRVGGEGPNELRRAAETVEPRLAGFAAGLGPGWLMTGSGTAFFRHCDTRAEAEAAIAGRGCWTAIARPIRAWAGPEAQPA
ncbi:MAG: 4-(cytidine 5'-diphospho)-2-C-methyl-D-erythritol kinase [Candidatus Dormibacteraeota bacterium]|nr:4-(cytidine 5'-diphospho)-2-C-methyl-D-erythritol kinase [Candidatus Dormibacteraeota bacterium]